MSRLPRRCSRILRASLVAFLALGLPACATGVFGKGQFWRYAGPPKAVAEVAILSSSGQTPLILHNIDGTPGPNKSLGKGEPMFSSSWDWGFTIELVPGEHTLVFDYVNHTGNMVFTATEHDEVTFVAEAGHLYRAIGANIGTKWGATVVDAGPIPAGFVRPTRTHGGAAGGRGVPHAGHGAGVPPSELLRDPAIRSFAVVPPRIEASGKDATDASRIATLTGQLQELVAAALRKSGWEVTEGAFGEKTMDEPGKAALVAAQSAYDALAPGLQSRPKDVAKGAFSAR